MKVLNVGKPHKFGLAIVIFTLLVSGIYFLVIEKNIELDARLVIFTVVGLSLGTALLKGRSIVLDYTVKKAITRSTHWFRQKPLPDKDLVVIGSLFVKKLVTTKDRITFGYLIIIDSNKKQSHIPLPLHLIGKPYDKATHIEFDRQVRRLATEIEFELINAYLESGRAY